MTKRRGSIFDNDQTLDYRRDYAPVRRIAQACINCRRKKARCTGERPECSNCQRLSQECSYSSSAASFAENPTLTEQSQEKMDQMVERIDRVEQSMHRMENKLDRLLNALGDAPSSAEVVTSPKSPTTISNALPFPFSFPEPEPDRLLWSLFSSPASPEAISSLPPLDEQLALIENYFSYCHNQPYSLFHERDFRERFRTGQLENYLILAVIANSARFADNDSSSRQYRKLASGFADAAWQGIITDCFLGTQKVELASVQTLTLLSIFDFTAGSRRHKSAWVKIGIAVRLAQDLHLMEELDDETPFGEKEERRRVFWSLYLLERLVSCGRGRPPSIMDSSCQLLQLPCREEAWESKIEENAPTLTVVRHRRLSDIETLSPSGMMIAAASLLSQCAQYMLQKQTIGPEDQPWHPKSRHATLVSDLMFLETQIKLNEPIEVAFKEFRQSDGLTKQHAASALVSSRLLFYLCQCLVFHPFLLREFMAPAHNHAPKTFWNHAKETSRSASDDMIDLVHRANEAGCILVTSFSGYCLTVAATIQALQATVEIPDGASPSLVRFQQCLITLESLCKYWSSATVMSSKLRELMTSLYKFAFLMNGESLASPLDDHEREFFWSLLDYSTISKCAPDVSTLGQRDEKIDTANFEGLADLPYIC